MTDTGEWMRRFVVEKAPTALVGAACAIAIATVQWTTIKAQVAEKADRVQLDSVRTALHLHEIAQREELNVRNRAVDVRLQRIEDMVRVLVCQQSPRDTYCRLTPREQ